jgi:hypothetical protein
MDEQHQRAELKLSLLPAELLPCVWAFLPPWFRLRLGAVCRSWRASVLADKKLWESIVVMNHRRPPDPEEGRLAPWFVFGVLAAGQLGRNAPPSAAASTSPNAPRPHVQPWRLLRLAVLTSALAAHPPPSQASTSPVGMLTVCCTA